MSGPGFDETVRFCRALRDQGLEVTPSSAIDSIRTLKLIGMKDRQDAFFGLRSVLTSRVEDFPVFEELFDSFWRDLTTLSEGQPRPDKPVDNATRNSRRTPASAANPRGLAYFLENWLREDSSDAESINTPGASSAQTLAEKDFTTFDDEDLEEINRLARRIARRLARRRSRRWEPVKRGDRVHLRRSLRQSLKSGGEMIELSFRRRKQKKTKLVAICDVSGSMDIYSRLLLQFIYGLQNCFARVETFVFSTALERITGHLKDKSYKSALDRLSTNVRGWSGGTLIGSSLSDFISTWGRIVDKRTIVLILSDGWDTGEPQELAASLAEIRRRAGRLIWLNPLLGSEEYQPLARGMQAALPHVDVFAPAHNLASLRALERRLML